MGQFHTVAQGECLASIAQQYGFADYKTIYGDANNTALRRNRPNPNILFPGDHVYIPDKKDKSESRGTSKQHNFQIKIPTVLLRLVIEDKTQKAYANKRYLLKIGEHLYKGRTNGQGLVQETIPISAQQGELIVWLSDEAGEEGISFPLQIGDLDPLETISGVQARLHNLGYKCDSVDGDLNEQTKAALRQFQTSVGLKATGVIDAATRSKLRDIHDTV
jgi:N-acetylmuramoyl-L-alanine amidase